MRHLTGIIMRPGIIGLGVLAVVAGCTGAAASAPPVPAPSIVADPSAMASHAATAAPATTAAAAATAPPAATPAPAAVAVQVSTGKFHKVDGRASGSATLFHQADGSFVITFEDFSIPSDSMTHVILVTNKDVTNDSDIDKTAIVDLGPLKGTSGMQDFAVPASASAMTLHTVVLWDTEMAHAIAAAPLQ